MCSCQQLLAGISAGTYDQRLSELYALDGAPASLDAARQRAGNIVRAFSQLFGDAAQGAALFSGPGRTEIGGNHTDHQRGHVLCGSVDMDMLVSLPEPSMT